MSNACSAFIYNFLFLSCFDYLITMFLHIHFVVQPQPPRKCSGVTRGLGRRLFFREVHPLWIRITKIAAAVAERIQHKLDTFINTNEGDVVMS